MKGKGGGKKKKHEPGEYATPEDQIAQDIIAAHPASTDGDERELHHLHDHQITAQFLEDAPHDQFVHARAQQEGDERGRGPRYV